MSLRTFPLELTSSDQTIFTVPPGAEATANSILATGTGNLTLRYFNSVSGETITILDDFSITEPFNLEKSFNFAAGDKLIASGEDINIFASVYFVSASFIDTPTLGPGPQSFVGGDISAGFFGEMASSELFTNLELDFLLGFTEGELMADSGWLKFSHKGRILYVQKRPMRNSISWDHIYSRGAVYGTNDDGLFPRGTPTNQYNPVVKGGRSFIPRLLKCASSDPLTSDITELGEEGACEIDFGGGSEWNELIYRVSEYTPDCSDGQFDDRGGEQKGGNWASYTDEELGIVSGSGRGSWGQESEDSSNNRINRGGTNAVSHMSLTSASNSGSFFGLRLVLELEQ